MVLRDKYFEYLELFETNRNNPDEEDYIEFIKKHYKTAKREL